MLCGLLDTQNYSQHVYLQKSLIFLNFSVKTFHRYFLDVASRVLPVARASPCCVINVASGSLCLALHQGSSLLSAFLNRTWYWCCAWSSAQWKSRYFTSRRPQAVECRLQWAVNCSRGEWQIDTLWNVFHSVYFACARPYSLCMWIAGFSSGGSASLSWEILPVLVVLLPGISPAGWTLFKFKD